MIIHKKIRQNWTSVDNDLINDPLLSWKAKGMLVYLLSKPEGWRVRVAQLVSAGTLGREGVRAILSELEDQGYIVRMNGQRVNGMFDGLDVFVYEARQDKTPGGTVDGFAAPVETANDKTPGHTGDGFTVTVEPAPVEPSTVNPTLVKTEGVSTEKAKTKDLVSSDDDTFDSTWKLYPRKLNRAGAKAKYDATVKRGADPTDLHAAVIAYAAHVDAEGTEPRFVKHGSTFFGPSEPWRDYVGEGELAPEPEWMPDAAGLSRARSADRAYARGDVVTEWLAHPLGGLVDSGGYRYTVDGQGRRHYVEGSGQLDDCKPITPPQGSPQPPRIESVEDRATALAALRARMATSAP